MHAGPAIGHTIHPKDFERLTPAISRLNSEWDRVKLGPDKTGPLAEWAGYSISLTPGEPRLTFFLHPKADDLAEASLRNLVSASLPEPAFSRSPFHHIAIEPGDQLSFADSQVTGTLGAFVKRGDETFLLSASHVLAPGGSIQTGQTRVETQHFATHVRFRKLELHQNNPADVAIEKWTGPLPVFAVPGINVTIDHLDVRIPGR